MAIALFCVGGFAHQMISALVNTLSADVFDPEEVGTASASPEWPRGSAASASLLVGALADKIGYAPLFACLGLFDIIGVTLLAMLIRGQSKQERLLARHA